MQGSKKYQVRVVLVVLLIGMVFACRKKLNTPQWEKELLVPLAKSSLNLNQLIHDTLKQVNADNSVTLIYTERLNNFSIDSLIQLPNTTFDNNTNIGSIKLDDRSVDYRISLGMIANNWPIWGPVILGANGTSLVLPNITGVTSGPHVMDVNDIFETATFQSGFMDFTVHNNFPVDIANVEFEIKNKVAGNVVVHETFPFIAAGDSATKTVNISGLTVEGKLDVSILNMEILGNGQNVLVDTTDDLLVGIVLRNMQLQAATAVFPAQNLVDEKVNTPLELDNIKLKEAEINTGSIIIDATSTIEDTIYFTYSIPVATLEGVPFITHVVIPPAPIGGSVSRQYSYDFANYNLDLTGEFGTASNVIYSELTGRIDSTGKKISLSLSDSLVIHIATDSLRPRYVRGFLGNDTLGDAGESLSLDLFNIVKDGNLDVEEVTAFISLDNYLGIDGAIHINNLVARNSRTSTTVALSGTTVGNPISVQAATDNPLIPTHTEITLDNSNSNIRELINALPDQLDYDIRANLNPGIDTLTTDFQDFAYDTGGIDASLNIAIPLSLIASNLTLKDTVDFSMNSTSGLDANISGILNLIVYNGFPLSSSIQVRFMDETYAVIDSLETKSQVLAGIPVNGKVVTPRRTVNSFDMDKVRLDRISLAKFVEFTVVFNSTSVGSYNKIYDDYSIDFIITADFIMDK